MQPRARGESAQQLPAELLRFVRDEEERAVAQRVGDVERDIAASILGELDHVAQPLPLEVSAVEEHLQQALAQARVVLR